MMQVGRFVAIAMIAYLAYRNPAQLGMYVILVIGLVLMVFWLFGSLFVVVDQKEVKALFGPGWIKRRIAIGSIADVKRVVNSWWMGWGVRVIPNGLMFNVAGLDAVELKLKSGGVFRIGTDEPERLEAAIREVLNQQALLRETRQNPASDEFVT